MIFEIKKVNSKLSLLKSALYVRSFVCKAFSGSLLKFQDYSNNFFARKLTVIPDIGINQ